MLSSYDSFIHLGFFLHYSLKLFFNVAKVSFPKETRYATTLCITYLTHVCYAYSLSLSMRLTILINHPNFIAAYSQHYTDENRQLLHFDNYKSISNVELH